MAVTQKTTKRSWTGASCLKKGPRAAPRNHQRSRDHGRDCFCPTSRQGSAQRTTTRHLQRVLPRHRLQALIRLSGTASRTPLAGKYEAVSASGYPCRKPSSRGRHGWDYIDVLPVQASLEEVIRRLFKMDQPQHRDRQPSTIPVRVRAPSQPLHPCP